MSIKATVFRAVFELVPKMVWRKRRGLHIAHEDHTISLGDGDIRARLYRPPAVECPPVLVYYHGGGFVIGSLESYDACCRDICDKTGFAVVSIDYRLAPEHPFPAAAEDSIAAFHWVAQTSESLGLDHTQLFVAGDSAGGNLAAIVSQNVQGQSDALRGQVLIYPVINHYSKGYNSYQEKATGHGLTRGQMEWFWDSYFNGSSLIKPGETEHPLATPSLLSNYEGLAPALILTAENDVLHDEGEAYAQQLMDAACDVQYSEYKGCSHGFVGVLGPAEPHDRGVAEIAQWLKARVSAHSE